MPLKMLMPPVALPLHIADVRQHLRQDITDDDNLITNIYLPQAVAGAQMETQRQLVAARYQYILDAFPGPSLMGVPMGKAFGIPRHAIQMPIAPLIQIVSIDYTAMDGSTQTMSTSDYTVDITCDPPRITPVFGKIWPIPLPQIGSVRITFDAGYVAACVANATTNTIALSGWKPLAVGDSVRLSNSGGVLPSPLATKTDYFIESVVGPGVYTLAATFGGAVIDMTNAGTGLNFVGQTGFNGSSGEIPGGILAWILMAVETRYSFRGQLINTPGIITKNPYVDRLLDPYRMVLQ
jgi:uncharacterized phiE125 gp8 family phage protein